MALLILIAVAQLVVTVLLLAVVLEHASVGEAESIVAKRAVRRIQQQTINALFDVAAEAETDIARGRARAGGSQ